MVDPQETTAGTGASETSGFWGVGTLVGDGRYRLTGRLGRGGMAEVFAAEDVRLGRTVAVKVLRSDLAEDPVSKARFTREAQAVAGLNHHAVVAVYDSGESRTPTGTVPYMVMELVEGQTIRDLLAGPTPPPVEQALAIVAGVLDALAYSHRHGIVHRDIKPANVIITTTGAVKVMDFGIARALHGAASTMTQTGMVMGTPQYLSPEQALGKPVDHRSDLYATGCLLYELLALRPPFTGETPLSVVYQHVQDEPRIPSQVSERVPPELDGLVLRALAKQPDERFQSAEEMREVVVYAHQALAQQGGWTGGLWHTGAVPPGGGAGPGTAATVVAAGAAAGPGGPAGALGSTAELGAVTGLGGGAPARPQGNRWIKPVLFALAAVVAIVVGVLLASPDGGSGSGGTPNKATTPPVSQGTDGPSDRPTDQQTTSGEVTPPPSRGTAYPPTATSPAASTQPPTTGGATTPSSTAPSTEPTTTTAPTTDPATTTATTEPTPSVTPSTPETTSPTVTVKP